MAKIAYIRVSTEHQNTELQHEAMPADIEKVFEEKVSGKSKERPQLKACLNYLRDGDEFYLSFRQKHPRLVGNGGGLNRPRR